MLCVGILIMWCSASSAVPAATAGATFCQVAKPHYWTAASSRRDKEQADIHNRKGKALCGWSAKS
jgi:hypothetical protein